MTRRLAQATTAVLLSVMLATGAVLAEDDVAHAATDGSGASSRVVGRGDIVTSIIGWRLGSPVSRRARRAPRCRWVTLEDIQIEWLAALSASSARDGAEHPVLDSVREFLVGDELPDGDLQARVCNRIAVDLRFVPAAGERSTVQILHRRMVTRLPAPDPVWSPPAGVAVPVHQPVFVSIPQDDWRPVESAIAVDSVVAEVRARPVGLRVISGDPTGGGATPCIGPARGYDPRGEPVRAQAARADTCTITYRTATSDAWIGTVTVLWEAEWRTTAGPGASDGWMPLGVIPRTRLFDRTAREVFTSIESRRR